MIEETSGNLLAADADALVNAVNTVGVMGRGIALAFKQTFPDMFAAYRRACTARAVTPGKMFVFDRSPASPRWIVCFPTKRHFREPSRLEDVRAGLADLVAQIRRLEIPSIAVPALGCGAGGLDWAVVRPLIVEALEPLRDTRVLLYPPQ